MRLGGLSCVGPVFFPCTAALRDSSCRLLGSSCSYPQGTPIVIPNVIPTSPALLEQVPSLERLAPLYCVYSRRTARRRRNGGLCSFVGGSLWLLGPPSSHPYDNYLVIPKNSLLVPKTPTFFVLTSPLPPSYTLLLLDASLRVDFLRILESPTRSVESFQFSNVGVYRGPASLWRGLPQRNDVSDLCVLVVEKNKTKNKKKTLSLLTATRARSLSVGSYHGRGKGRTKE